MTAAAEVIVEELNAEYPPHPQAVVFPRLSAEQYDALLESIARHGNAFSILGLALRAAKQAGWTETQRDAYAQAAMSGDYDRLLAVTQDFFDVH